MDTPLYTDYSEYSESQQSHDDYANGAVDGYMYILGNPIPQVGDTISDYDAMICGIGTTMHTIEEAKMYTGWKALRDLGLPHTGEPHFEWRADTYSDGVIYGVSRAWDKLTGGISGRTM